jgi:hypothetical protein
MLATQPDTDTNDKLAPSVYALMGLVTFGLYWFSAIALEERDATVLFGADAHLYAPISQGEVYDRVVRFHPVTVWVALAWLKLSEPLTPWLDAFYLMKGMHAAVGGLGVAAAMWVFAAVMPRRYVVLFGAIYAFAFGTWFFSSIEESKGITALLSALYIGVYLRLRERWSARDALLLTAILLLACLNEIVAGFLLVIPIVDTFLKYRLDPRRYGWLVLHGLAGPLALGILEGVIRPLLGGAGTEEEGASHISMLLFYVLRNDFSPISVYSFVINWFFFNIAAPTPDATLPTEYGGYFEPSLSNYFSSPATIGLVVLFGVMIAASFLPKSRARPAIDPRGILLPLTAYALLRFAFYIAVNTGEAIVFASPVTLVHILLVAIPFTASNFPWKRPLLAVFAALLFITNGAFMLRAPPERPDTPEPAPQSRLELFRPVRATAARLADASTTVRIAGRSG